VTVPFVALVVILFVVAGCSSAASGSPGDTPEPTGPSMGAGGGSLQPASEQPSQEPTGSPAAASLPASVVDPIVADAAQRAGVPVDQVAVQSAEAVTFPDGSLGCPLPDMAYTQVQVDGYKVVVVAGGTTYDYRGTTPESFRLCTPQK
jgi:hypothetical protein